MQTIILRACALLAVIVLAAGFRAAQGCTCFSLEAGGAVLVGRNYDWDFSDALVIVNKRGLEKPVGLEPGENRQTWFARYGSLTFNQYGREFPTGGVNEKGLVVEVLWLAETVFPPEDDRMALQSVQWIQYQLDTAADVGEVIASLEKVRIGGTVPIHFFVADRAGEAASIEFLDGKAVIHRTDASKAGNGVGPMPVAVLTNDTYEASHAFLGSCIGWGGSDPIPASPSSLHRFARAATGAGELMASSAVSAPEDIFRVLGTVAQERATQWSIVYDLSGRRIHFKTLPSDQVKTVHLADLDFNCGTQVRVIDIDTPGAGNVRGRWTDYTRQANRDLIGRAYAKTDFLENTSPEALDRLAAYPERARCLESPPTSR